MALVRGSRWNHALALSWVAHENLCLYNIYRNADESQRLRYLPDLCSGRTVALRAANDLEVGGGGRGDIHMITAASVMYAAETLNKVLNEAVQIHGGSGYIWESEVNRLYCAIKLLEIGAGTTEVRKVIIGDELLRR